MLKSFCHVQDIDTAATTMYREMDMRSWLEQAEAAGTRVAGG